MTAQPSPRSEPIDVLVIGCGAAGLGAALAAREAGAQVRVVARDAGATGLGTGAWDLDAPGGPHPLRDRRTLAERLDAIGTAHRSHPLARLGARVADVQAAVRALVLALPEWHGSDAASGGPLVVSEVGLFRRTVLAHSALLDLAPMPRARVAVADLPELAMDARFVAASLDAEAHAAGDPRRFVAVELEVFRRDRDETLLPAQLAAVLDGPGALERFIVAARRALAGLPFDALLVPPILGLDRGTVRAELESALGVCVGEVVSSLHGPQGLRLGRATRAALDSRGVALAEGRVRAVRAAEACMEVVLAAASAPDAADASATGDAASDDGRDHDGEVVLRAGCVVLATGRLLGGGLAEKQGELEETLAGLSVFEDGAPRGGSGALRGRDPVNRLGLDPFALSAGWRAGVSVDSAMRPRSEDGEVVSDRLFAAGSILDGIGPTGPGAGLVACAATGYLAGRGAAARALADARRSV